MVLGQIKERVGGPSPFRFQAMWLQHEGFMEVVERVWQGNICSCPLQNLSLKLIKLKQQLKMWNKSCFGNVLKNHDAALGTISKLEASLDRRWDEATWEELMMKRKEFFKLDLQQELFLK